MTSRRISIGNQTSFTAPTATFPFEYAIAHGFDAFEWFPDTTPEGYGFAEEKLDAARRRDIRNLALAHDIRLSVHAPWWIDVSSEESVEQLDSSITFAANVGAKLINIHISHEATLEDHVSAVVLLLKRLHPTGVMLSIENTVQSSPDDFNMLFSLLKERAGRAFTNVGVCLDIGHANLCAATRNDYLGFLDRLAPTIPLIHAHVHENWGDRDSHLTLFTGPSAQNSAGVEGFIQRLLTRSYEGALILEQWPDPPELLDNARERLLAILSEQETDNAE
ncbi:MAG: sugar phosphate isomerase/epimerase [Deltaproteobacteria bacterium]|nr:sugar phosphate isomerase/epimerase [Deltaproteobacteria bacterium]